MASKRSSKRSLPEEDRDLTTQPAVKRSRSASRPLSVISSARAGAGRSASRTARSASEPPEDGGDEVLPETADAGDSDSDRDEDLLEFEDPEVRYERIKDVINEDDVNEDFAAYVRPVLALPDDMERGLSMDSISLILKTHGMNGTFWREAWPIEVYARYDQAEDSFDTPWSGDFDERMQVEQLSDKSRMRWNWYVALKSLRDAGAAKEVVINFADHYREALRLQSEGHLVSPVPCRPDQEPVGYLNSLSVTMDQARVRESWSDATERLRAAFGDGAAFDLQQIFREPLAASSSNVALDDDSYEQHERKIWWKHLHQKVTNSSSSCPHTRGSRLFSLFTGMCRMCIGRRRRGSSSPEEELPWFQTQYDYITNCGIRFGQYEPTENLDACVAYANERGSYNAMCREMEAHIRLLRTACLESVVEKWEPLIKAGATFAERNRRFKMLHSMQSHFAAGGLPYTIEDLLHAPDRTNPLQIARAKAYKDFKCPWKIAKARAEDLVLEDAKMRDLVAMEREMKKARFAYGPEHAGKLKQWSSLIRSVDQRGASLDPITTFRFHDLHDRVLEFHSQFGFLAGRAIPPNGSDALSQQNCEDLVQATTKAMQTAEEQLWKAWRLYCIRPAEDEDERQRRFTLRDRLKPRGIFFLPYGPAPRLLSHIAQTENLGMGSERRSGGIPLEGMWKFRGTLGTGKWGHAGLWQKHTGIEWLADQLVIKESYVGRHFDDPGYWDGEMWRRVIKEEKITRDLGELMRKEERVGEDEGGIVKSRGYAIYETLRMVRIYMEYCPHGDLEECIERYFKKGTKVPERQLWAILEAMVSALCFMKFGKLPSLPPGEDEEEEDAHITILHRDIKPANIFLSRPSPNHWTGIPRAKLGDFGLATREIPNVTAWRTGMGTERYCPPEQQTGAETLRDDPRNPAGVCAASDLWAVGRVLLSLMNLQDVLKVVAVYFDQATGGDDVLAFGEGVEERYSEALKGLVRDCLKECSGERPELEEVWMVVRDNADARVGDLGERMKEGGAIEGEGEVDVKRDEYVFGLAR